jgi:di/tricarboxylate transporter
MVYDCLPRLALCYVACDVTFASEGRPFADLNGTVASVVPVDDVTSNSEETPSARNDSVNTDSTDEDPTATADERKRLKRFAKVLTLSIAYSANIGGTATLTGTPTNLLVAEVANRLLNSFSTLFANYVCQYC